MNRPVAVVAVHTYGEFDFKTKLAVIAKAYLAYKKINDDTKTRVVKKAYSCLFDV